MKESKVNSFFKKIDYWRWLGFLLAVIGAYILGNAEVITQWIGWVYMLNFLFNLDNYGF